MVHMGLRPTNEAGRLTAELRINIARSIANALTGQEPSRQSTRVNMDALSVDDLNRLAKANEKVLDAMFEHANKQLP